MSEGTEHLWRAVERSLDSPQEALGPALNAGADDLDGGSRTGGRPEAPLAHIKKGGGA